MIFIAVKWPIKPEYADQWLDLVNDFTEATRAEPGNLWFDWSRSVDDPNEFVLVEAFQDDAAEAHVTAAAFQAGAGGPAAVPGGDAADRQLPDPRRGLVPAGRDGSEVDRSAEPTACAGRAIPPGAPPRATPAPRRW